MGVDLLSRVRLVGELSRSVVDVQAVASPLERIRLSARIAALLKSLGAAPESKPIAFDLSKPEESLAALREYRDKELSALPDAVRPFEMLTLNVLAGQLKVEPKPDSSEFWPDKFDVDAARKELFAFMKGAGIKADIDAAEVDKHLSALRAVKSYRPDMPQEIKDELDRIWAEEKARRQSLADKLGELTEEEYKAALGAHEEAKSKFEKVYNALLKQGNDAAAVAHRAAIAMASEEINKIGAPLIRSIMDRSPITQEKAKEWADAQTIDPAAIKRLKKAGYTEQALRNDMADFYRLSGGKSSLIEIRSDGNKRAHADGVHQVTGKKIIRIDGQFNRTVLFHEMAHFLENDPIANHAALAYLHERREDAKLHRLSNLTGSRGYSSHEVAYKDEFIHPYIGKHYKDGATEVFSMGVQYLANPADAAMFAAKDPEMFAMVTGYLSQPLTKGMQAKFALHGEARATAEAEAKTVEEERDEAVRWLASAVTLESKPEEWAAIEQDSSWETESMIRHYIGKRKVAYVGSYKGKILLSGVFKNMSSGRWTKGFLIVYWEPSAYSDTRRFFATAIHGEREDAIAALRLTEFPEVREPVTVRNTYLTAHPQWYKNSCDKKLIDLYKEHGPKATKA